jgi:hypothetical protein
MSSGLRSSLVASLDAALDSIARGRTATAREQLGAFINKVEAQAGKSIPSDVASGLITDARRQQAVLGP